MMNNGGNYISNDGNGNYINDNLIVDAHSMGVGDPIIYKWRWL